MSLSAHVISIVLRGDNRTSLIQTLMVLQVGCLCPVLCASIGQLNALLGSASMDLLGLKADATIDRGLQGGLNAKAGFSRLITDATVSELHNGNPLCVLD